MSFNPSQREAIRHKDGPMLVLAGPGSGKTLCHYGTHQTFDNRIWNQSGKHSLSSRLQERRQRR